MKKLLLILVLASVFLSGCSVTEPVSGRVQNSDETFSGTATGYMDGSGHMTLVTSRSVVCKGNYVYVTSRKGEGVFSCEDGRSGPFQFVSTGRKGTGYGDLGGERFTFTFGGQ